MRWHKGGVCVDMAVRDRSPLRIVHRVYIDVNWPTNYFMQNVGNRARSAQDPEAVHVPCLTCPELVARLCIKDVGLRVGMEYISTTTVRYLPCGATKRLSLGLLTSRRYLVRGDDCVDGSFVAHRGDQAGGVHRSARVLATCMKQREAYRSAPHICLSGLRATMPGSCMTG